MHWPLAIDICQTIVERLGACIEHSCLLATVTQWASAARAAGRLDEAERMYLELGRLAMRFQDIQYGFRSRIGLANVHLEHGNYPEAQARIDEVIADVRAAGDPSLNGILSRALHTRAAVAMCRERYAEGVEFAREALHCCDDAVERDMILHDIASALISLGRLSAARDALLLIRTRALNHSTRWSACVNLMEIAGLEGRTKSFEYWHRKLANQQMRPWHRGHFFRLAGEGYERLGRYELALEMYETAISIGEAFGVNDVTIMAEARANEVRARRYLTMASVESSVSRDLEQVIAVVSELRIAAGIPAGVEDP
jgi:tetratricopeptide (TPR) repeat protein